MDVLALFMLGFAPGIFWLWLIYQRDGYIPAPPHLVVRTFLWGIAVAAPVVLVESILSALAGFEGELEPGNTGVAQAAYVSFVVAGLTEELAKYLVVRK
ncbi:MAG: PrsW family glutamic-type intramembrane protease, partial [Dehalococcoidia bacterium]|nr:PrsW family glutamic-type intramembrane protease [Dehalococcoidia bacterium]